MVMIVVALVRKTGGILGFGEEQVQSPEALVADRGSLEVPEEILKFEAQAKPGLGAHGQGVRLSDQSEKDIEDQLKVCFFSKFCRIKIERVQENSPGSFGESKSLD